jgi:hypothetical protein
MADLVGDHASPREIAARPELALHVPVEGEIEIDALVGRAVEGAHGGRGVAASGGDGVAVENELGAVVALIRASEGLRPGVLRLGEDVGAEVAQVALGILGRGDARASEGKPLSTPKLVPPPPPSCEISR